MSVRMGLSMYECVQAENTCVCKGTRVCVVVTASVCISLEVLGVCCRVCKCVLVRLG